MGVLGETPHALILGIPEGRGEAYLDSRDAVVVLKVEYPSQVLRQASGSTSFSTTPNDSPDSWLTEVSFGWVFSNDGGVFAMCSHWFLILLVLLVWSAWLFWHWKREQKKLTT
jgi:hypothetical protein